MKKNFLKFFLIFFFLCNSAFVAESKNRSLKIAAILPLSGKYEDIGNNLLKTFELTIFELNNLNVSLLPFDNQSTKEGTKFAFQELQNEKIDIVIGPVFFEHLKEISKDPNFSKYIFFSLTNETTDIPPNVISFGVNINSQINAIKPVLLKNNKTKIFFGEKNTFSELIFTKLKNEKISFYKDYFFTDFQDIDKQSQIATSYWWRNKKLKDLIDKLNNSQNEEDKIKAKNLEKLDTLGGVNYQQVFTPSFDNNLISILSFFDYYDVNYDNAEFISLNQWFDKKLLIEPSLQNLIFPSINFDNFKELNNKFVKNFGKEISNIEILAYDLLPLLASVWYSKNEDSFSMNDFTDKEFKGKSGIFKITKSNTTERKLNLYQIQNKQFKAFN
ncbi:MAG: hypothetical protein ACO3O8_01880 [Pelagibacteraceae bacterium]|jgi:hypothetical protein